MFTAYFLLGKRARDADVHAWSFLAAVFIGACVVVVPWALVSSHDLGAIQGADWLLLFGLILFPGMVGHGLMTWAHHYVDVTVTSMMTLGQSGGVDRRRVDHLRPGARTGADRRAASSCSWRSARSCAVSAPSAPSPPKPPSPATSSTNSRMSQERRSMMVTLAWPPPSHMVCRP